MWRIVLISVYGPVVLYLSVLVPPRLRRSLRTGGLLSLQSVALRLAEFGPAISEISQLLGLESGATVSPHFSLQLLN